MIGKITLATALLIGTAALAQQSPTNPTTPGNQPNTQNQPAPNNMSGQCWDTATNQVRQRGTVGAGGNPGANPSAPQNQQTPGAGSANQRPAGMANC